MIDALFLCRMYEMCTIGKENLSTELTAVVPGCLTMCGSITALAWLVVGLDSEVLYVF